MFAKTKWRYAVSKRNRALTKVMVLGCLLLTSLASAQEVDLSGSWNMSVLGKSPTGDKEIALSFERNGFNLAVTMNGKKGALKSAGYIDGREIRFYYVKPGKKEDIVAKFTGHVRGDLMGGEVDMGKSGISTWKATRGPEKGIDLSGQWTLQMRGESPSGLHLIKMTFGQEHHKLLVTLKGEVADVECEGYVEGDIVTFYYVRHTQGDRFVAKFTGQIGGDMIGGEVDMGEMGKTTWRASRDI
jgi:hypothetical protein